MNVVPVSGFNTLPVIYDRGLIGVMHDWYGHFTLYYLFLDIMVLAVLWHHCIPLPRLFPCFAMILELMLEFIFPRCEPFDTYPRTYDLLHAAGLFSVEQKRYKF